MMVVGHGNKGKCAKEALAKTAVQLSTEVKAKAIVTVTGCGGFARKLSKYRPSGFILAVSHCDKTINGLTISRGVITQKVESLEVS